ncbi:MAG: hypothetical protein U1E67_22990 [Hyphomicrobiales bacterium]
MSKILGIILVCMVIAATVIAAKAADEAQCEGAWIKAGVNKDGMLQPEEVASLAPASTGDDGAVQMTEAEFMDACKKGMFDNIFATEQ